jgi:leader peptidase (prepilin peptidase)/N-methyltransferase
VVTAQRVAAAGPADDDREEAMTPLLVLAGVLGLAVGSFLNVVVHRVPRGESLLRPASHCPRCERPVRPWENVPVVSWLALRGRCAGCRERISVRYPLVEAGTAALFVAITLRFGPSPELPAYLYLGAVSLALALIDLDVRRLPNSIVLPSYVVGAALLALPVVLGPAALPDRMTAAGRALLAMVVLFVLFLAISFLYRGGMGLGDVKLAGILGLHLGWLGWNSVVVGAFGGFLLGGLVGAALLLARRASRRTAIPFGPFMLAGALIAVFLADPIASWYTTTFLTPA